MEYLHTCHCGAKYKIQDAAIGRSFVCPKCQERNTLLRETLVAVGDAKPAEPPKAPSAPRVGTSVERGAPADVAQADPCPVGTTGPMATRQGGSSAVPPPLPAVTTGQACLPEYPWDTPQSILDKAEKYREGGGHPCYSCKVEEFLEGLLKWQVFTSIKQKSKGQANLAELHVYPDLVGIVQRPQAIGCLAALLNAFLPLRIASLVLGVASSLLGIVILVFVAAVVVEVLAMILGWFGAILCIGVLVAGGIGFNKLSEAWSQRNLARIAARIRANPASSYAIKQMFKRAGWLRWQTGVGHGQSGACMAERYWQRGDVVQLVRVDARHRLLKRSLLLLVMDAPMPRSPGLSRIAMVLFLRRMLTPRRRIYVVDLEGGMGAADAAANTASAVLGVPVTQGKFGWLALSLA